MRFTRYYLDLWGFPIYYYGMILATGILAAFLIGLLLFKMVGYKEEIAYMLLMVCVPIGILCARFYYIIFYDPVMFGEFFNIRGGGIAIYGGVIGGAIGIFIVSRIKRVGFFTLADIVVIGVILAQSIGRWGNYVNQEAHGFEVGAHVPPFTVNIDGRNYLATFFYESMLNLIGFALMFAYYVYKVRRDKYLWGTTSAFYLIWYGVTRMFIEPMRTDSLLVFPKLGDAFLLNRVSFVVSFCIVIAGAVLLYLVKKGKISQENEACKK